MFGVSRAGCVWPRLVEQTRLVTVLNLLRGARLFFGLNGRLHQRFRFQVGEWASGRTRRL